MRNQPVSSVIQNAWYREKDGVSEGFNCYLSAALPAPPEFGPGTGDKLPRKWSYKITQVPCPSPQIVLLPPYFHTAQKFFRRSIYIIFLQFGLVELFYSSLLYRVQVHYILPPHTSELCNRASTQPSQTPANRSNLHTNSLFQGSTGWLLWVSASPCCCIGILPPHISAFVQPSWSHIPHSITTFAYTARLHEQPLYYPLVRSVGLFYPPSS